MSQERHEDRVLTLPNPITQVADMPYALYLSLQGKYFVGYADEMTFGRGTLAWAALYNPPNSDVTLHVYVWTATNIGDAPLESTLWINGEPPGRPHLSELVTPANTALRPLPRAKIRLLEASEVKGAVDDGLKLLTKTVVPEETVVDQVNGVYTFGPGGSLIITLSYPTNLNLEGQGRVAFGWYEEPICQN